MIGINTRLASDAYFLSGLSWYELPDEKDSMVKSIEMLQKGLNLTPSNQKMVEKLAAVQEEYTADSKVVV